MAEFYKMIPNKYDVKTYKETKKTYDWICKAIHGGNFSSISISSGFHFSLSKISCVCQGIEEFVENAYDQTGFDLITMYLSIYSDNSRIAFINVSSDNSISVSAYSKVVLEKIVMLLETTDLEKTKDPISVTYVETQIKNDGLFVQGDHNVIANDHSSANGSFPKQTDSKVKQWFIAVSQNIMANWVWYVLCSAVGAVVAIFALW